MKSKTKRISVVFDYEKDKNILKELSKVVGVGKKYSTQNKAIVSMLNNYLRKPIVKLQLQIGLDMSSPIDVEIIRSDNEQ